MTSLAVGEKLPLWYTVLREVILVQQQKERSSSHSATTTGTEEDRPIGAAPTLHPGNLPLDAITARWLAAFAVIVVSGGDDTPVGGDRVDGIT